MVFDSAGRFIQRLGRKGNGPGEFQWPTAISITAADTVLVYDMQQRRLTVLDPAYRYVRAIPLPRTDGFTSLAGGTLAVNAVVNDPTRIGLPLHLIRRDGTVIRSFGAERPTILPGDQAVKLVRRFAGDGSSGFWTAYWTNEYRLEHWDATGHLLQTIVRNPDWYRPYAAVASPSPTHAPDPSINGLWVDSLGRVWTMARVADRDWTKGLAKAVRRSEGIEHFSVADEGKAFDTIIEVIDPVSGRLIAAERFPEPYDFVVGVGLLDRYVESEDGTPTTEIWRARLRAH